MFRMDDATKGADCVLVLSGNAKTRPDHAALLVKEGYSKKIFLTQARALSTKHPDIILQPVDISKKILATYNLKADIIPSTKGGATSTFDEAYDFVNFLKKNHLKRVIIVTDSFHTARAYYAFRKILDLNGFKNVQLQMSAAPNNVFNEENWYTTELGVSSYVLEPIKYIFYIFHNTNTNLVKDN